MRDHDNHNHNNFNINTIPTQPQLPPPPLSPSPTTHHVRSLRTRTVRLLPPLHQNQTHPPKTNPSTSQNNDSLTSLSQKVSALRSVTIDIYDNARDQHVIDSTSETFSSMTSSLTGSSRRLVTMAQSGNKVAVIKLAGILIGVAVLGYWILRWIF